jgi:uncharacterized membrane protein
MRNIINWLKNNWLDVIPIIAIGLFVLWLLFAIFIGSSISSIVHTVCFD